MRTRTTYILLLLLLFNDDFTRLTEQTFRNCRHKGRRRRPDCECRTRRINNDTYIDIGILVLEIAVGLWFSR